MGMGPVVRSLKNALDGMPVHVRQLGEMFRRHGRTQKRSIADVHDLDAMHVDAPRPRTTPGFHADGTVKAEDFRTPRDGAYYWSGMYPRKGDEIAVEAVSALAGDDPETLIARVREIEAETMAVEVDWSTRTLSEGGRVARAAMAERHPELSEAALDALYWAFTYNWR